MLRHLFIITAVIALAGCNSFGPKSSHVSLPQPSAPTPALKPRPAKPAVAAIATPAAPLVLPGPVTVINPPADLPPAEMPAPETPTPEAPAPDAAPPTPDPSYNRPRLASAATTANKPQASAVASLISEAQRHYQQNNFTAAIATCERGLRIERRTPALYLVLAKSYLQQKQTGQAAQFANQGLRYSISGSEEAIALDAIRREALAN